MRKAALVSNQLQKFKKRSGHSKCELQSHVRGVLSAYIMYSAAGATRHRFTYKVLGTVVCKAVFMDVYAVSNFVMKKLQALAEPNCAACISRWTEGVDFCPSRLSGLLL